MAYTTADAVKEYLGIEFSGDDALLTGFISAAQQIIDRYCGERTFEATSDTTRYHDAIEDVDGATLWLAGEMSAITTVTNGDGTEVSSDDYVTEPRNTTPYYAIKLKSSASVSWTYDEDPENAITVEGRWAYTTSAPADIAYACERLAGWMSRLKDSQVFDVTALLEMGQMQLDQALPRDVRMILWPYRRRGPK